MPEQPEYGRRSSARKIASLIVIGVSCGLCICFFFIHLSERRGPLIGHWVTVGIGQVDPGDDGYPNASVIEQLEVSLNRYSTVYDWAIRRSEIRRAFAQAIGLPSVPLPGEFKTITRGKRNYCGYSVENVAIESIPGMYCCGNLYRPLNQDAPFGAILCPHGHFEEGRFRKEQQIRCAQLARMGAVVLSYSMIGDEQTEHYSVIGGGYDEAGQLTDHCDPLVLQLQIVYGLRAIDFLCQLDDVDVTRIGVTGCSAAGTHSLYLAVLDDRIRACAPVLSICGYGLSELPAGEPGELCACEYGLPVMRDSKSNMIEFSAIVAPRAQLIVSASNEQSSTFPGFSFAWIRQIYRRHGAEAMVSNVHIENEGHDFGPTKRAAVYKFFAAHLDLETKAEASGTMTIESREAMEVFNSKHKLPVDAAIGREAVEQRLHEYLHRVAGESG